MTLIVFPAHHALLLDLQHHWIAEGHYAHDLQPDGVPRFFENWLAGEPKSTGEPAPNDLHMIAAFTTLTESLELDEQGPTARQVFMALYARRKELLARSAHGTVEPADLLMLEEYEVTIDALRQQLARVWLQAPVGEHHTTLEIGARVKGEQAGRIISILGPDVDGAPIMLELDTGEYVSAQKVEPD